MRRKLQVFVSSTYEDLREERQAAVEAILKAGHIPAGMELFTAGSRSQFDVIKHWIDESDVFMLILGSRYGSIEPTSGLSYVEQEFSYARGMGKPFFSVVLTDAGREAKVKTHGTAVIEQANVPLYHKFRGVVTSHLCAFFATSVEVKLAVLETLPQISANLDGVGWVAAADVQPSREVMKELTMLSEENRDLRAQLATATKTAASAEVNYDEIYRVLLNQKLKVPGKFAGGKDMETSLLRAALAFADDLARGVANSYGSSESDVWIMYNVASPLASWGLSEHGKVPNNVSYQQLRLSKAGIAFLNRARVQLQEQQASQPRPGSPKPSSGESQRAGKRPSRGKASK